MNIPWLLVVVLGPVLLALALAYSMWRNKRETGPGDEARSDRAARALRESLNAEDKAREGETPGT